MLKTVLSYLPGITCLFWLTLNTLLHKRGDAFKAIQLFTAVIMIAALAGAIAACTGGMTMLVSLLTRQFMAVTVIPAALYLIRKGGPMRMAWFAVPTSLLFAQVVLLALSGTDGYMAAITGRPFDRAGSLIYLCAVRIFYSILAVETVILIFTVIKRIIRTDDNARLYAVTAASILYVAMEFADTAGAPTAVMVPVYIALSVAIFTLSYLCMPALTAQPRSESAAVSPREAPQAAAREKEDKKEISIIEDASRLQADEENLRMKFEDLIVTEQLFLRQGLRITDIATMLETNRTYISRLVNNTYNMSFSDYINTLRIDYAEQYLLHNRDAKQSDIAASCGFPNASAFNNVFKKITGVTPKIWLATRS